MLDLEFRPKTFGEVVGNSVVIRALLQMSKTKKLGLRSILFGGPKGCGKTTLARIVARASRCSNLQNGEPCNSCDSCESISNESNTSFEEFDAASHGSVDKIRSIVDDLDYGTMDGGVPIIILDEAHRLGPAAQDSMLKALEERRMVVILCTTEPNKIRPAIRDRVDEFSIRPPVESESVVWLKSICQKAKIDIDDSSIQEIAKACNFFPRTCLNTIWSISCTGPINHDSIAEFFRYNQIEIISDILKNFDSSTKKSIHDLDSILSTESPTWVRDTIVNLINNASRVSVGCSSRNNFSTQFYSAKPPPVWFSLAKQLTLVDNPKAVDIELALIENLKSNHFGSVQFQYQPPNEIIQEPVSDIAPPITEAPPAPPAPPQAHSGPVQMGGMTFYPRVEKQKPGSIDPPENSKTHLPEKKTESVEKTSRVKSIVVDGVSFDSKETLTTFDDKVSSTRGSPVVNTSIDVEVKFDQTRLPMSDQEFSLAIIERLKK